MKLVVCVNVLWQIFLANYIEAADDDYNIVHKDGSFEFGYKNPDSYHFADGTRSNVVRGEFGGRNPKTGGIDSTIYTAGPRGFRPRGKNVYRKYDLNQNGPRPIGSPDDPYYDPYEDPSYNFAFRTRTYSRQENANRAGDVNGRFTYLDDVGERHNVEFIAGKNTGFHVKTPFPDSSPREYGPLFYRGRGRPIPRGKTSIQRGLDGSYKFVSAGPDQRRTEVSDSTGHVRGSYTYLDDKGVQHSVHYIAGPETGYRVLKKVKGAHLPALFPFERPEIIPPDFYGYGPEGDVFDTAASGRPFRPGGKPSPPSSGDNGKDSFGKPPPSKPGHPGGKPGEKPTTAGAGDGYDTGEDEVSLDFGDLFGGGGGGDGSTTARPTTGRTAGKPTVTTFKPTPKPGLPSGDEDDGSYKPEGEDGSYKPGGDGAGAGAGGGFTTSKPGGGGTTAFPGYPSGRPTPGTGSLGFEDEYDLNKVPDKGFFGTGTEGSGIYEGGTATGGGGKIPCLKCTGTLVTNIGYKPFSIPPGVSVRAHIQSIDLYPFDDVSPSAAYKADIELERDQLNEASSETSLKKDGEVQETIKNTTTPTIQTTAENSE